MEPAPTPMRLAVTSVQSRTSSPLRTSRQSLPEPTPATPTSDRAPWATASVMSWGPKAVMSRSPEASAVRASAKRWNITVSIWRLYLAAYSGRSQSGDSAGTLSMPSLAFTGAGRGLRIASLWASALEAARVRTAMTTTRFIVGLLSERRLSRRKRSLGEVSEGAAEAPSGLAQAVAQLAHRSEEHTSELQSLAYLVCRLLLEKKKKNDIAAVD